MSVAYEPRTLVYIHDGSYPSMAESDHDPPGDRFGDADVSDLSAFTPQAILTSDRDVLDDPNDAVVMHDSNRSDLSGPSGLLPLPTMEPRLMDPIHAGVPAMRSSASGKSGLEPETQSPPTRIKAIAKPEREVTKHADGKFYCPRDDCLEATQGFSRRCEWSKHMDKHERPYRCEHEGCEKLPGFTYSGGLLRHEREVHGKHGGPKNTVNCPHVNCKRHTGKGFSRQENLNEHLRRVHTDGTSSGKETSPPSDHDSEKAGAKRKRARRGSSTLGDESIFGDELKHMRQENQRVQMENEELRAVIQQMIVQISELQDALRLNNATPAASSA